MIRSCKSACITLMQVLPNCEAKNVYIDIQYRVNHYLQNAMYVCKCVCMYVCMYILYVYMYVYMYVCMYVCVCLYIPYCVYKSRIEF